MKKLTGSTTLLTRYNKILKYLAPTMEMNLTRAEVKALVKFQLGKNPKWKFESNSLEGFDAFSTVYSAGNQQLYVMKPDEESIKKARQKIKEIEHPKSKSKSNQRTRTIAITMLRVRAAKMTTYNVDAFPEIKDVQRVELDILIKVARLCEERGFTYFIESGTALGAVRHGGFIPWDDDIDIGMPRQDYEKFLDIAQEELGDEYFVQTRKTDPNAPFSFAKVRKNGTTS